MFLESIGVVGVVDEPLGFALRSNGTSPEWCVGDGDGTSMLVGVFTDGLDVRSGVVVGDTCGNW